MPNHFKNIPPKPCEFCGNEMVRGTKPSPHFEIQKYCSQECTAAGISRTLEKDWSVVTVLTCPRCGVEKPADQFPLKGKTKKGIVRRYPYCGPCHTDYERARKLKFLFNLSLIDYQTIETFQSKKCAVCGIYPKKKRLSVDHNHSSGLIRGLLCSFCNRVLGLFRDDIVRFEALVAYLKNPPATHALGGPRYGIKGRTTNKVATIRKLNKNLILSNVK